MKYKSGRLYKIFFNKNHSKFKNTIYQPKSYKHTWPFIDIFVNVNKNYNDNALNHIYNLQYNEFPLKKIKINGIKLYLPTNGYRIYNKFKKDKLLTICKSQKYMHKYEKKMECEGKMIKLCKSN